MKYLLSTLLVLIAVISETLTVSANTVVSDPEKVLREAFNALISHDFETYIENVYDLNYSDKSSALEGYKEAVKNDSLIDYEIVSSELIDPKHKLFIMVKEYQSGFKVKAPVNVKKLDDNWKVFISDEITDIDIKYGEILNSADFQQSMDSQSEVRPMNGVVWRAISGTVCNYHNSPEYSRPPSTGMILNIGSLRTSSYGSAIFQMYGNSGSGWVAISKEIRVTTGFSGSVTNRTYSMGLSARPNRTRLYVQNIKDGADPKMCVTYRGDLTY